MAMRTALSLVLACAGIPAVMSQSNIDPAHHEGDSDFIGTIDWRPGEAGATINPYYCSGWLYGLNVGWIAMGTGEPLNKLHYSNLSATDFGVNVDASGALRGFAYGANIGWINFEAQGNPKVDWVSGKLTGKVYSANAGWINLSDDSSDIRLSKVASSPDSDADGLPDAWEIAFAGNLGTLSGSNDSDGDGISDLAEFIAGTSPLDASDFLAVGITVKPGQGETIQWQSKPSVVYRVQEREAFDASSPWVDSALPSVIGTGDMLSVTLPVQSEETHFFRVEAYPPLTAVN